MHARTSFVAPVLCIAMLAMARSANAQRSLTSPVSGGRYGRFEAEGEYRQVQRLPPLAETARKIAVNAQTVGYETSSGVETIDERLSKLEEAWGEHTEAETEKKAETALKPTMKFTGRIHVDGWSFPNTSEGIDFFENPTTGDDVEDRVFFRRLRLGVEGGIFETMIYKLEMDFHEPADVEMKDNYFGFTEVPILGTVLIGNQKRPLGLDHLNSSRFNMFIERPLVVEAFNEDARRFGIAAKGYSGDERYNWRYGVFALENLLDDGEVIGDSRQLSGNVRLASSPWYDEFSGGRGYFHWAVAGMLARPDGDVSASETNENLGRFRTRAELRSDNRWLDTRPIAGAEAYEILGLEAILNVGPLLIVSEYQNSWLQRDSTTTGTGPDVRFHGAYVYVAYFLTGEFVPYNRQRGILGRVEPLENFFLVNTCCDGVGSGWGAWQIAARYSYLDLTDHDIQGGVEDNITFALNWYWTSHSSFQFNVVYGDIKDHAAEGGFTAGHFTALGTRLRVDF